MSDIKIDPGFLNRYRATGVIRGRYLPSSDDPCQGSILKKMGCFRHD